MEPDAEAAQRRLDHLKSLRERFKIRAVSLPADLALVGLLDDLQVAAAAALALPAEATSPMYPLTRTAFEAAQRIVAIATDDAYLRIGTRAWLYYQRVDAAVLAKTERKAAEEWLETVETQMRAIWSPHNPEAEALLASEKAWLQERWKALWGRPLKNFLDRDLAEVVEERHARVFDVSQPLTPETKSLNRGIYAALSRESHARLRIEPAALVFSSSGTVEVIPRPIDEVGRRRTLLRCLDLSLAEAAGGLSYLLQARDHGDAKKLQDAAGAIGETLRPGFKPDLGLHLARSGGGITTFHFLDVPIYKLGVLPEGLACWSAGIVLGDREFIATFDVPGPLLGNLAAAIRMPSAALRPTREIVKHTLEGPPRVNVECSLGEVQRNADQTFVPLLVKRLVGSGGV